MASSARANRSRLPITTALSLRGRAKAIRALPVSRRVSQLLTSCSISSPTSTGRKWARASSASVRAASLMSPISRSIRAISSRMTLVSLARSCGSSTRSSPSTAERSEASGFLSSWLTSAAKASILSIRCLSDWLMSETARASIPISSIRSGKRGTFTSRDRPRRTRCAAIASRLSGRTIVRARNEDSKIEIVISTAIAPRMKPR